jgi:hypothetical protein
MKINFNHNYIISGNIYISLLNKIKYEFILKSVPYITDTPNHIMVAQINTGDVKLHTVTLWYLGIKIASFILKFEIEFVCLTTQALKLCI